MCTVRYITHENRRAFRRSVIERKKKDYEIYPWFVDKLVPLIGAEEPAEPAEGHGPQPPVRKIPGITAPDQFPMGCVDCHVYYPEMNLDARVSTLMNGWGQANSSNFMSRMKALAPKGVEFKGRHPDVPRSFGDIPAACIKCHAKPSMHAPSFGQMMHVIHLEGVKDGHFLSIFQGECTHCHKLEKNTGTSHVPSGPERAKPSVGAKGETGVKKQAAISSAR